MKKIPVIELGFLAFKADVNGYIFSKKRRSAKDSRGRDKDATKKPERRRNEKG